MESPGPILLYEAAAALVVAGCAAVSARSFLRARASGKRVRDEGINGLVANAARRNYRDEAVLLVVQLLFVAMGLVRLFDEDPRVPAKLVTYEALGVMRIFASVLIAWRCGADYRDREDARDYYQPPTT